MTKATGSKLSEISLLAKRIMELRRRRNYINVVNVTMIFIALTGIYAFGIGRSRFQASSQFIVREPASPMISSMGQQESGSLPIVTSMLGSIESGRYLEVYLKSPGIMTKIFEDFIRKGKYSKRSPDLITGLAYDANEDRKLEFFRRQIHIKTHELTGIIELTTTALDPETTHEFNEILLREAQLFVNKMNKTINSTQLRFASMEVDRAQERLNLLNKKLNIFKLRTGQLDPVLESSNTAKYIADLEAKLIDLKVEEASLKSLYRYKNPANVQITTNKIMELERLLKKVRQDMVRPDKRDLSGRSSDMIMLQNQINVAEEGLRTATLSMEHNRIESQRQLKFLVILENPRIPVIEDWSWRWKVFLGAIAIVIMCWSVSGFLLGVSKRV